MLDGDRAGDNVESKALKIQTLIALYIRNSIMNEQPLLDRII